MLLFFYFLPIPPIFPVNVARLEIPYEYLATRTRPISTNYNMSDKFDSAFQETYNSYCNSTRCYFPVFNDSGIMKYTLLTDINSTCLTYPNCLAFTKKQYQNYTIVFGNPSIQDDNLKDGRSYEVAKCDSEYFSFTRANGLNWCFNISTAEDGLTHDEAENECETEDAYLNGFQTIEEQGYFLDVLDLLEINATVHLGAMRGTGGNVSSKSLMVWTNSTVSTNQTLANNLNSSWFDGSGVYLVLRLFNNTWLYDDVDDKATGYSCGWYAT